MSKSVGNTIDLADGPEVILKKIKTAVTDPKKIRLGDKGHPEVCTIFTYHKRFNAAEKEQIEAECRSGNLGCVPCKENAARKLAAALAPLREKRERLMSEPRLIEEIIEEGSKRARAIAQETMHQVRTAMKLWD